MIDVDDLHHHDHAAPWPPTWQGRVGLLAFAIVTVGLNATGALTQIVGLNTALLVAALGAYPLAIRAWQAIRSARITYDVAIAVAAVIAVLAGEFLAAAEVVIIVLVGDGLEHWAMHRAERAIAGLMSIQPDRATVIREGHEMNVASADVRLSDRVVVRSGERLPVDGVVAGGEATVDQSLVTGESVPVLKRPGAQVYCGTILDHGALEIRPEQVGTDTTLARIGRLVSAAKRRRPPLVRTADRLSQLFLPVILVSAVAVYFLTGEVLRASAVLLVACSCALVYAAPAAFAAAIARLARDGILVKGGDTLEALSGVNAVAFDKTGTLTEGRPSVTAIVPAANFSADEVLRLAATAEQLSEHAVGRALVAEATRRGLELPPTETFSSRPGRGVAGRVNGRDVHVGSVAFLRELGSDGAADIDHFVASSGRPGDTHVVVAVEGVLAGLIGLMDTPRTDAVAAVAALKTAGIKDIYLLTGDERVVAEAVAEHVGIERDHVYAALLPEEKLLRLKELSAATRRVLMVGDGVNDAPALAAAHVGLAFGRGAADLSAEAAQAVALEPKLEAIAALIVLARQTVWRVRFNIIAFALGVNALAILAAGLGYLKPAASALLHQIVSLVVILGSVSLLIEHRLRDPRAWREWGAMATERGEVWRAVLSEALDRGLTRHRRALARGIPTVVATAWLLSGVVVLGPGESAAVQRFGRLVDAQLSPGLHLRAPWPIEVVTRHAPRRVRVLELGFRSPAVAPVGAIDLEWNTPHGEGQVQQVADENLVLTGDENMLELYAVLHYTIADPARYLFGVRDGEALVRMVAEGTLRNLAAGYRFDALLTTDRQDLEERWTDAVRVRLAAVGAGVDVLAIHLADVHPPVEVVDAFRDVASAEEERVTRINEADGYSKESVPIARGNAKAKLEEAAGYRVSLIDHSQGDAARFLSRVSQAGTTVLTMFRLQMEALEAVLPGKRVIITDDRKGGRRTLIFFGQADLLKILGQTAAPSEDEER